MSNVPSSVIGIRLIDSDVKGFQVGWDEDASLEVLGGLGSEGGRTGAEVGILGVVEHQVLHAQVMGELASLQGRAVVLLVGLKLLAVFVEAERLPDAM